MRIRDLEGLGPKSEAMLASIDIDSVDQFKRSDAFDLYRALKEKSIGVSLNMLYAMLGAQEGVGWQDIARDRKTEILMRLDDMGLAP
ncbi:MAG: TfoX/Sxy family protein [Pseudomonadales bacterium]|nr:TfoX/Sxy family protein [Pseudomonadales bacterium]